MKYELDMCVSSFIFDPSVSICALAAVMASKTDASEDSSTGIAALWTVALRGYYETTGQDLAKLPRFTSVTAIMVTSFYFCFVVSWVVSS